MDHAEDEILDVSKFSFTADFETQVQEIFMRVRLTRSEVENLQCLIDDLTFALSYIWSDCQVYPFGSIVTGLGIKTSDIDCFIKIPPHLLRARVDPIIQAKNVLKNFSHKFTELFSIMTAKVPILKFLHIPTHFRCDINFTSFAGVKNSQLIGFMLNLDSRAKDLAIIVKYWSKVLRFTGTNLMANYSLTLLVIFYLQMTSVLPSVEELQKNVRPYITEKWNTAYDDNIVYSMSNDESLYDLLGGFFEYYCNFDYKQHMISPYMGIPISKEIFANLKTVPNEYHLYKNNVSKKICKPIRLESCICIQDPFDHSRNCSVALFERLFCKIQGYFKVALDLFNECEKDKFLSELFNISIAPSEKPNHPKHKFKNKVLKPKHVIKKQKPRGHLKEQYANIWKFRHK